MIIYGSKVTHRETAKIKGTCPNCASEDKMRVDIYQKYAHIFWIPLFPLNKVGYAECSQCKYGMVERNFPSAVGTQYNAIRSKVKLPIWTFSGLFIIALIIGIGVVEGKQKDSKNEKLIENPQVGDVYEYKAGASEYTLIKVNQVDADTVYLLFNDYQVNRSSGFKKIREQGNDAYSDEPFPVLKEDLKEMFDTGKILNINR